MATSGRKSCSERNLILVRICREFPWTFSHVLGDPTHASTNTGWGITFRPCELFALGNAESPLFVTGKLCGLQWTAVQSLFWV